jgi:DNA (cytosine-5)-methyltransferase 1
MDSSLSDNSIKSWWDKVGNMPSAMPPLLQKSLIPIASSEKPSRNVKSLTCLELFAGAGGLALGTHRAGFQHLGLIEKDTFSVETLRNNSKSVLNLPSDSVIHADARDINYSAYWNKVDLLSGGPPCQPFSTAGRSQGDEDERNMFPLFLDAVARIQPRAVLIENVKGLRREIFRAYFDYIIKRVEFPFVTPRKDEDWRHHHERLKKVLPKSFDSSEMYEVGWQMANAADYGVPQCRERVLIFAFRRDLGVKPFHLAATHSKTALLTEQWVTERYWKRHGVEAVDHLGKIDKKRLEILRSKLLTHEELKPWRTVRDVLKDLPIPVTRGHEPEMPNHVQHPGARAYKCHTGSAFDFPAKTLKAGTHGTPGGENMLKVADGVRYFTTREAARLQTFPDEWIFQGTWGACIRQMGNAVPVELACLFASAIHDRLRESRTAGEPKANGASRGVT